MPKHGINDFYKKSPMLAEFGRQTARDNKLYMQTDALTNCLMDASKEDRQAAVEDRKKNRWKYRNIPLDN